MFYAPCVDNSDIGGKWDGHNPFVLNSGDFLDKEHSIFNYIIIPVGDDEKKQIVEANKGLYDRLVAYKSYFKMEKIPDLNQTHHH